MEIDSLTWLNEDFIQRVLRNSENDETIVVTGLAMEPAVAKGDNYGSIMIRAAIDYSHDKSGCESKEKISLIIKVAPIPKDVNNDMCGQMNSFENEIKMMNTTLVKMKDILKEDGHRFNPRVLHTEIGEPSLLVMEDLIPLGYRMVDRLSGLDLHHATITMKALGKFHASSVALHEKEPDVFTSYNGGMYGETYPRDWKDFVAGGFKNLAHEVTNWTELGSSRYTYSEKLFKFSEVCYERATRCSRPKNDDFNVLNHGDCWIANMLFRYDKNGKVTDHIFVDFQISIWTSPAIDISNIIDTSVTEEVDLHHRDALVETYLETLTATMQRLGCKTKPPTMSELQKILRDRELYTMVTACLFLPMILLDKKDVKSFDEILENRSDLNDPAYKGLGYRKIMIRRLPKWNARGLFDV